MKFLLYPETQMVSLSQWYLKLKETGEDSYRTDKGLIVNKAIEFFTKSCLKTINLYGNGEACKIFVRH